jgi:hypothetical protein
VMAHFPRQLQHFASSGNSRYDNPEGGSTSVNPFASGSRTLVYDPFVGSGVFVT